MWRRCVLAESFIADTLFLDSTYCNTVLTRHAETISTIVAQDEDGDAHGPQQGNNESAGTGLVVEKSKVQPKKPPLYKVLLLNDDYTPMEFVVLLLMRFFNMDQEQAKRVMLHVHTKGVGICGVFPREIAETKVRLVLDFASENQHPLKCTMERE